MEARSLRARQPPLTSDSSCGTKVAQIKTQEARHETAGTHVSSQWLDSSPIGRIEIRVIYNSLNIGLLLFKSKAIFRNLKMFSTVNLHSLVKPTRGVTPKALLIWRIVYAVLVVHAWLFHYISLNKHPL